MITPKEPQRDDTIHTSPTFQPPSSTSNLSLTDSNSCSNFFSFKAHSWLKVHLCILQHLEDRYKETWTLEDVDARIHFARYALMSAQVSVSHHKAHAHASERGCSRSGLGRDIAACSLTLANALNDRFYHTSSLENVEEHIQICNNLQHTVNDDDVLTLCNSLSLGVALRTRCSILKATAYSDLTQANHLLRAVIRLSPAGAHSHVAALSELGETLCQSYELSEDNVEFEEACELHRAALAMSKPDSTDRYRLLYRLSYTLSCNPEPPIAEAQRLVEEAIELLPPWHYDRSIYERHLARLLLTKWRRWSQPSDRTDAERILLSALEVCGQMHPGRPLILISLTYAYTCNDPSDWQQLICVRNLAVNYARQALLISGDGHPQHSLFLNLFIIALSMRGEHLGSLEDFEEAILLQRQSLSVQGNVRSQSYINGLNNLSLAIIRHSTMSGDCTTAAEAVALMRQACALQAVISASSSQLPLRLSNLGHVLGTQALDTEDLSIYVEIVQLHEQAVTSANVHDTLYGDFMERLAGALMLLYKHTGNLVYLDRSIATQQRVFEIWTLADDPDRHHSLALLAKALCARFHVTKDIEGINNVRLMLEESLSTISDEQKHRDDVLTALAQTYLLAGSSLANPSQALKYVNQIVLAKTGFPRQRLIYVLEVLEIFERTITERDTSPELREQLFTTYQNTMRLVPRCFHFGLDARARLEMLYRARNLTIYAANRGLFLEKPEQAVELLEEGRAAFWSHCIRLRASFDGLPKELADRLKAASRVLDDKGASGNDAEKTGERRKLIVEWEALLSEARAVPGYERFLVQGSFDYLSQAATKHPVIVFIPGDTLSHAIIIRRPSSAPQMVQLPNLTTGRLEKLECQLKLFNRTARAMGSRAMTRRELKRSADKPLDVYSTLWMDAMLPVIEGLGLQVSLTYCQSYRSA